jgi:hypothetical protein
MVLILVWKLWNNELTYSAGPFFEKTFHGSRIRRFVTLILKARSWTLFQSLLSTRLHALFLYFSIILLSTPRLHALFLYFNIILHSTPSSSNRFISLRCSRYNIMHCSHSCLPHHLFNHPDNIRIRVQIMNLLIICIFLRPVISSFVIPSILLSKLFSNKNLRHRVQTGRGFDTASCSADTGGLFPWG